MMRKRRFLLAGILLFLSCFFCGGVGDCGQERITSIGKIVTGMTEAEALAAYGVPDSARDNVWYYAQPQSLYVYCSKPLRVRLLPTSYKGYVGEPLELKVFAGSKEEVEVTSLSSLQVSEPVKFTIARNGVLIPKATGTYQVLAVYKRVYSNTSTVSVSDEKERQKESLDVAILPYKPLVNVGDSVEFFAFRSFRGAIEDISDKAEWFLERNDRVVKLKDSRVALNSPGKAKVFCKFGDKFSYAQDIRTQSRSIDSEHTLKHLTIFPVSQSMLGGKGFYLYAFATYTDNKIENVSKRVKWVIKNNAVLTKATTGMFITKNPGITEVFAELNNVKSLPAKVIVCRKKIDEVAAQTIPQAKTKAKDKPGEKEADQEMNPPDFRKEEQKDQEKLSSDLKKDIDDLMNAMMEQGRYNTIKIVPDNATIAKGEQVQLSAFGAREDGSENDITILAQWQSLDEKTASVAGGLVSGVLTGTTMINASYGGLQSASVPITVTEPKLVSIELTPASLRLAMGEKADLSAQGNFSDSSHKDITSLVDYKSAVPGIVRVDKGTVNPLKLGQTTIVARYSNKESLGAQIVVIRARFWLWILFLKIVVALILVLFLIFGFFYMLTENVKKRILSLYQDPKAFVIALHDNLDTILEVFGLPQPPSRGPLLSAMIADEQYAPEDALFLKFAERFEEAKYSAHQLPPEASSESLQHYHRLLRTLICRYTKRKGAYYYCKALVRKTPFFLGKPPLINT